MRVFKTKTFARVRAGLVDADLGGGVIKRRIARKGEGRSGGFRSILLFRRGALAVFVYGFAKNDRDSIETDELKAFRKLASVMLALDARALTAAVGNGTIVEVERDG